MNEPSMELLLIALNRTDSDIKQLRTEIHELRREIKDLNVFKWKVYGMASVITVGLSLLINKIT